MSSRNANAGYTLVELMIVVAIVGVLAALAVQGTQHYLAAAKTAEARQMVGAIGRAAVAAYERDSAKAQGLKDGKLSKRLTGTLCGSSTRVPKKVPRGRKYQPSTKAKKDFQTGTSTKGWTCLGFSIDQPIYYRYSYRKGTSGLVAPKNPAKPSANGFEAGAMGDVDGDKTYARFALTGEVNPQTKRIKLATAIYVELETE